VSVGWVRVKGESVRVTVDFFSLIYVIGINAPFSYTICCSIKNKFGDYCTEKKLVDQNTHFLVIISQLKILVIKTQLFGDQKNADPITTIDNSFLLVLILFKYDKPLGFLFKLY